MATSTVAVRSGASTVAVWTAVGLLAVAAVIVEIIRARGEQADGSDLVATAADDLARALRARLRHDEEIPKVADPIALPCGGIPSTTA